MKRFNPFGLAMGAVMFAGVAIAMGHGAVAGQADLLTTADSDHDGSLDLKEVSAAALAKFAALDPDHDGSLDQKEAVALGITPDEFAKADPDHDGTIDKNEFVAVVSLRFAAAEQDNDKTVDAKELASAKGQALAALLK